MISQTIRELSYFQQTNTPTDTRA